MNDFYRLFCEYGYIKSTEVIMNKLFKTDGFMERYTVSSHDHIGQYDEDLEGKIYTLVNNNIFMEQLLIASRSTYTTLIKFANAPLDFSEKKKRSLLESLQKYWNRSCTRTTPFGLFSKVNIGDFQLRTKLLISPEINHKKVNLDMKWLVSYIKNIEKKTFQVLVLYHEHNVQHKRGSCLFTILCRRRRCSGN